MTGINRRVAGPYALAAMPARYAIERGAWREAAKLEPRPSKFPFTEAMTHFARALGAARSGDPAAAEKDVEELAPLRDALKAAKNEYWATEVEVRRLAVAAWTALAQGKSDEALGLMRRRPTSRTRARRTSSRRGASCPRASCSATCCWS